MNDPQRWLEDPNTSLDLRQVLESAGTPAALPEALHARLSEYAVALASQGVLAKVGGTSALAKLLSSGASAKTGVALLSLLAAAGAGTALLRQTHVASSHVTPGASLRVTPGASLRPVPSMREPTRTLAVPALPSATTEPPHVNDPPAEEAATREKTPKTGASALRDTTTAVPSASSNPGPSSIAAEAKLLETARSFLDDSPALALQLTERDQVINPAGQLNAEREFIAIEALLRLGRRQEAERRAAPRLEQAPDSLYARRLRQLLTVAPAAPKTKTP